MSPFVSLHLSPVVSQPGCLARLSGWTGSFVTLCLPSFVSRCLPAWMPGTALWVDGFICLPLSPFICLARLSGLCFPSFVSRCLPAWMSGTALQADRFTCLPLSPFICLPLSPSLDVWHGSLGGQFHLSPFVSLHLAPLVSQPGCLSRLSRRTDSLVSLGSPSFVSHLCGWTDSFVCLCLPLFVSRCLPAWMPLWVDGFICLPLSPFVSLCLSPVVSQPGTALWVDGFICLPLSPSLDVWHSRSAVSFTSRGSVLLAGSGLPSASALASVIPCLVDVGGQGPLSALHLDFDFAWARGGSSSLSIVGYTLSVRSVPRYQLRPLSVLARI